MIANLRSEYQTIIFVGVTDQSVGLPNSLEARRGRRFRNNYGKNLAKSWRESGQGSCKTYKSSCESLCIYAKGKCLTIISSIVSGVSP